VSTAACAAEYAAQAVARKRSPLGVAEDLAEFARVATFREKPTWAKLNVEYQGQQLDPREKPAAEGNSGRANCADSSCWNRAPS
jgi:hypothetical protein